jgi:hypothetical protein
MFMKEAGSRMLKENMNGTLIDFPQEKTCLIEQSRLLSFFVRKNVLGPSKPITWSS